MADVENILISLESRYAQSIYLGKKKVELRRRVLNVQAGDVVWIYEKVPVGAITGSASISAIHVASPHKLWRKFGSISGLSRSEFFKYFAGLETACALELTEAKLLPKAVSLAELRSIRNNFQPPQFFLRLQSGKPILAALRVV